MKLISEMNVRADALFEVLIQSLKHDIAQATGKEVSRKDLVAGFTYDKMMMSKLGKSSPATATIVDLTEPTVYHMKFTNNKGENHVIYNIRSLDNGRIEVTYEETYTGMKKFDELNNKVMGHIFKKSSEKRVRMLLEGMKNYIETT